MCSSDLSERAFFMELTEIVPGISMSRAECVSSKGLAPQQMADEEAFISGSKLTIDENFYGDEDFDIEELDEEGFGDLNFDDSSLFNDDRF